MNSLYCHRIFLYIFFRNHKNIMTKKILTKKDLEKLIEDGDPSVKFVQKKKTSRSSEWWNFFHHVFVNGDQQQFVSCNTFKGLLLCSSLNGTNNLRTHFNSCSKNDKPSFVCQKNVHDFYLLLNKSQTI
jgi:hypothetical protein